MAGMMWAIGLMSGTSLDGIDVALLKTDGNEIAERGPWLTHDFGDELRMRIREVIYGKGDIAKVEQDLTLAHVEAVKKLLLSSGFKAKEIGVIGFHGQTIQHRPAQGITWQIGNGGLLADKTGISVVCDFRRRDVAAGGQGAPLVPLYHAALAKKQDLPIVIINMGGIANISWVGRSEAAATDLMSLDIMAFDTGPGNVLLNEWALKCIGKNYDVDGKLALAGKADDEAVSYLMKDPFFTAAPPKSLDRNHFDFKAVEHMTPENGAATLAAFAAAAVEKSSDFFPVPAKRWYVSGGGRHNPSLMAALKQRLDEVQPVEALGWEGDALEAQAFAFLAVRSLRKLPLSLPTTTGVNRAVTGGAFYPA